MRRFVSFVSVEGSTHHEPHDGLGERLGVADVLAHGVARRATRRRDLMCAGCGYGVVVTDEPERCPLCGGTDWDFSPWRPFSGSGSERVA
jgi:rubrerythrin